jgi:WD40 repeat protein
LRIAFFHLISFAVALLAAMQLPSCALQSDKEKTRAGPISVATDALGDPLPPGAIARLGTTRFLHPGSWLVRAVSFTPEGTKIISTSDSEYSCWDSSTGRPLYSSTSGSKWWADDRIVFSQNAKFAAAAWGECHFQARGSKLFPDRIQDLGFIIHDEQQCHVRFSQSSSSAYSRIHWPLFNHDNESGLVAV